MPHTHTLDFFADCRHGGIVCESDPGFDPKTAKVHLLLRKCFRNQIGPKIAKAPPLPRVSKTAKAPKHLWA